MNVIIELIPGIITLIAIAITGIWLLKVIFRSLRNFFREIRHMDDFYRYGRWYDPNDIGLNNDSARNTHSNSRSSSFENESGTWQKYEGAQHNYKKEHDGKRQYEEEQKRHEQQENQKREAESKPRMSATEKIIRSAYEACRSRETLDRQHKLMRKKYHPDNGGKPEDFVMADHLYDVYKAKVA